jgi:hypothetical protein
VETSNDQNEFTDEPMVDTTKTSDEREPDVGYEPPPAEDEYTPNYKFKVLDKEHEFDDFIRGSVTKENEQKIRELYEKAYGIEHVKTKYNNLKTDYDQALQVKAKYDEQQKALQYLGKMVNNRDYNSLFKQLKIGDKDIINYALERVNYQELPEDQKREYDRNIESRQRLSDLEYQNQELLSQSQNSAAQARDQEINNLLATDQMQDIVKSFDERAGKPGSFKMEVIRRGAMMHQMTGHDPRTEDVVQEVAKLYGHTPGTGTANAQTTPQNTVVSAKPTLPKVRAGSNSPARKLPRSLDDLRKAAAAMDS